jgi:hypothetical protein
MSVTGLPAWCSLPAVVPVVTVQPSSSIGRIHSAACTRLTSSFIRLGDVGGALVKLKGLYKTTKAMSV